jgi:hypothetical protein
MATTFDDNALFRNGAQFLGTLSLPANCIGDSQFDVTYPLGALKVIHQSSVRLAQAHGTAATAERRVAHIAYAAGTVVAVKVTQVVAAIGDSTVTIDVRKNGTTILTGTISITSAKVAFEITSGTIGVSAYVAGDVLEIVQTVSAGTGTLPQGVCCEIFLRENPA